MWLLPRFVLFAAILNWLIVGMYYQEISQELGMVHLNLFFAVLSTLQTTLYFKTEKQYLEGP